MSLYRLYRLYRLVEGYNLVRIVQPFVQYCNGLVCRWTGVWCSQHNWHFFAVYTNNRGCVCKLNYNADYADYASVLAPPAAAARTLTPK